MKIDASAQTSAPPFLEILWERGVALDERQDVD
jgi:hypothetical protein